jgi:hypothetical protein
VEVEHVVELLAQLLHANNIIAPRTKYATEKYMVSRHFVVLWPAFDLVCEAAPVRLKTCSIAVITTLVDADISSRSMVHVNPICFAVAIDVDEAEPIRIESWVEVESFVAVAYGYALRDECEILEIIIEH